MDLKVLAKIYKIFVQWGIFLDPSLAFSVIFVREGLVSTPRDIKMDILLHILLENLPSDACTLDQDGHFLRSAYMHNSIIEIGKQHPGDKNSFSFFLGRLDVEKKGSRVSLGLDTKGLLYLDGLILGGFLEITNLLLTTPFGWP